LERLQEILEIVDKRRDFFGSNKNAVLIVLKRHEQHATPLMLRAERVGDASDRECIAWQAIRLQHMILPMLK